MITAGIFSFSVVSVVLLFAAVRRYERLEKTEMLSYVMIFAWGAFLFGIAIAKTAGAHAP